MDPRLEDARSLNLIPRLTYEWWWTSALDRCYPKRGRHVQPHRGCILRNRTSTVWILYQEQELDFNQYFMEDVEIFSSQTAAEQAAYWLNSRLSEYDREYNGWHVGEERTIR